MIFKGLYEAITFFQYLNIGLFLIILTYASITINKQKVIFYIFVFFLLSEVITIFKYSIVDEVSLLGIIFYYCYNKKEQIVNFISSEKKIFFLLAIIINLYFSINIILEIIETKDIRLIRFSYLFLAMTFIFFFVMFIHRGYEKVEFTKANYKFLFLLITFSIYYLIAKGEILELHALYGRILDQGKTWSGTFRTSLLIIFYSIVTIQCYFLSKKKYRLYYIYVFLFTCLLWASYFDTRSGTIFAMMGLCYVVLMLDNLRHKIFSLLFFIMIFMILSIKGDIKNFTADYISTNLKHNLDVNIFYDKDLELNKKIIDINKIYPQDKDTLVDKSHKKVLDKIENLRKTLNVSKDLSTNNVKELKLEINKLENELEEKIRNEREKNYKTKTSNLSRLAQYRAFYQYISQANLKDFLIGTGVYSHKILLVPYIDKVYKKYKIAELEKHSYAKQERNDTSNLKIFRTNSFIGMFVDYGLIGLIILIFIVIYPFYIFIKDKSDSWKNKYQILLLILPTIGSYMYINATDSLLLFTYFYFISFFKIMKN